MWVLDRRPSQLTPSGTPPPRRDNYSPAPRRPYGGPVPSPLPPRPGLPPRTSSLSLMDSPASSTTSLASMARIPNGAPRRRTDMGGVPPPNIPHPLHVLEAIMGGPPRKSVTAGVEEQQRPEEVVDEIDFGGLSLHDFVAAGQADTPVHTYSAQSVEECMSRVSRRLSPAHRVCRRQGEG